MTKAERETICRWDCESGEMTVYTADPLTMKRLTKRGYQFTEMSPHSWQAVAPKRAVILKKLPLTPRTPTGRPFLGQKHATGAVNPETTS